MTSLSADVKNFLEVVDKVAASVAEVAEWGDSERAALEDAGMFDLAMDAADLDDARAWLVHTVRVAAHTSPSLAFVLAARYAGVRALGGKDDPCPDPTFALLMSQTSILPTAFDPANVVAVDVATGDALLVGTSDLKLVDVARTGLRSARLRNTEVPAATERLTGSPGRASLVDWDLLTSAALLGLAQSACQQSWAYAQSRRQFGAPVASFAGLRALLADMELRVQGIAALLDAAVEQDGRGSETVAANAGRVAISVCNDAIQAHGGYGYIDEYPIAGLLRDAVSLQARSIPRRQQLAQVALHANPTGAR